MLWGEKVYRCRDRCMDLALRVERWVLWIMGFLALSKICSPPNFATCDNQSITAIEVFRHSRSCRWALGNVRLLFSVFHFKRFQDILRQGFRNPSDIESCLPLSAYPTRNWTTRISFVIFWFFVNFQAARAIRNYLTSLLSCVMMLWWWVLEVVFARRIMSKFWS